MHALIWWVVIFSTEMEYRMKPISIDLRWRILHDNDSGMATADAAAKYFVSHSLVKKLRAQRGRTGSIEPIKYKPGRKRALADRSDELRELIDSGRTRTLKEIREQLGCQESLVTIRNEVRRLGYRYKKRHLSRLNKSVRM